MNNYAMCWYFVRKITVKLIFQNQLSSTAINIINSKKMTGTIAFLACIAIHLIKQYVLYCNSVLKYIAYKTIEIIVAALVLGVSWYILTIKVTIYSQNRL